MRKQITILLTLIMVFSLTACGQKKTIETTDTSETKNAVMATETVAEPIIETEPATESVPATEATEPPYIFNPENIEYPILYSDDTAVITIYREWYESAWCYAAHLEFTDYTRFGTECANGKYNSGTETVKAAAERLNAILCINGSYSLPKHKHCIVTHGIIQNGANSSCWTPGIYNANTGYLFSIWDNPTHDRLAGVNLTELVNAKFVTDTFSYSPPIVSNGQITANDDGKERRVAIGTNGEPGDIWVLVTGGNLIDDESEGLTYMQTAQYMIDKGCNFVIPLDGGVNACMVYQGVVLNYVKQEKSVVDFVYFK